MKEFNDKEFIKYAKATANNFHNGISIIHKNSRGKYKLLFINDYLIKELGYTKKEVSAIIENDVFQLVYANDVNDIKELIDSVEGDEQVTGIFRLATKDHQPIWYMMHMFKVRFMDRECVAVNNTNVQELIGTQHRLELDNSKWLDIIDSIPIGIGIFNIKNGNNTTIAINQHLLFLADELGAQLDGNHRNWTKEEMFLIFNQSIFAFCASEDIGKVKKMLEGSKNGKKTNCIFKLRGSTDENQVYVYSTCVSKESKEGGRTYYITFQNRTADEKSGQEVAKKNEELFKLSYFDNLTGVHNRNAYNAIMTVTSMNKLSKVGVAFCDLNGLKRTNDTLGHSYGDLMLIEFTNILKKHFENNQIYRISGDEFVIIRPSITKEEFSALMTQVISDVKQKNNLASVGFIWKPNVTDIRRRVQQAEEIMYVEKQRYYEETKTVSSKHRPILLNSLMEDLENGAFRMYLQPKANFTRSKVLGAEALVRKVDSDGRIIPPYEFVPQLEKEKLIPKIDFFILEEACKFLERLKQTGKKDFVLSVNMSRVTLVEYDYIKIVSEICNRYDFDRNQLEFEITESVETMDNIRLAEYIKRIKALGIRVSLDDVGTDYSSLPLFILDGIDYVKLDRSLVTQIGNEKAHKLLEHLISMCHDLDMKVIAEGVEKKQERSWLRKMDCDMYQGYILSRPIPADEFAERFL